MNTLSREEAAVAQQKVDEIQQACAILNKLNIDIQEVADWARDTNRNIALNTLHDPLDIIKSAIPDAQITEENGTVFINLGAEA